MIAALYVRKDSIYKTMAGVDAWDAERDARRWPGGSPVVAHPPCAQWGQLRQFAKDDPELKALALLAVDQVRAWGGVLEHPAQSTLWAVAGLPAPGARDELGGWTLPISQFWWGHRAEKKTFLYIVGCEPRDVPAIPLAIGRAPMSIGKRIKGGKAAPELPKPEREHTPPELAAWLVELARRCDRPMRKAA